MRRTGLSASAELLVFLQNIQKMLGFAPSRAANKQGSGFFTTPSQSGK